MSLNIAVLPRVVPKEGPNIVKEVRAYVIADMGPTRDLQGPEGRESERAGDRAPDGGGTGGGGGGNGGGVGRVRGDSNGWVERGGPVDERGPSGGQGYREPQGQEGHQQVPPAHRESGVAASDAAPPPPQERPQWQVWHMGGSPVASPCSGIQDLKTSRRSWGIDALGTVVVEVELHSGIVGVGLSTGGAPATFVVEEHLARFVEGQDVHNIELIWESMFTASFCSGSKGLAMNALSAIDLALWDALGKVKGEPVYNLLGGKTKDALPIFATSVRPDLAYSMGFHGCKIPLCFGPADGDEGMRRNIEHLKRVRAVVGPDFMIVLDCFMSLTVPYAIELVQRIAREVPGGVKWLEEVLPPYAYGGMAEIKAKVGHLCQFATGEHEYGLQSFKAILDARAADILQPDVTFCGGLTEARRICALARAYDIPVIPHGCSSFSYHLQFAFSNIPCGELMLVAPRSEAVCPLFGNLFKDEPLPVNGYLRLDASKPGFGLTLNRDVVVLVRPVDRTPLTFQEIEAEKSARTPSQKAWMRSAEETILLGSPPYASPRPYRWK